MGNRIEFIGEWDSFEMSYIEDTMVQAAETDWIITKAYRRGVARYLAESRSGSVRAHGRLRNLRKALLTHAGD